MVYQKQAYSKPAHIFVGKNHPFAYDDNPAVFALTFGQMCKMAGSVLLMPGQEWNYKQAYSQLSVFNFKNIGC